MEGTATWYNCSRSSVAAPLRRTTTSSFTTTPKQKLWGSSKRRMIPSWAR